MYSEWSFNAVSSSWLLAVALIFLLAGGVKGVVGLGLPTVAVGLLGIFMAPGQAAALLIVPSLVTNVWQLLAGGRLRHLLRRLWPMLLSIVGGTVLGARAWPAAVAGGSATLALGVALVLYALLGLFAVKFAVPARHERWLSVLAGLLTGAVTAVTAVFVIPAVPFLQALQLDKDELIQALGLSFTVSTMAMALVMVQAGALQQTQLMWSLLALLPALLGMLAGQALRARISAAVFRRCFFTGLLLLGLHLSWRL